MRISSRLAAAILVLVSVSGYSSQEGTRELVKHPNVLFISLDDMNDWVGTLGGHEQALTPSLDRFSESGVNFTRNYTPSPGCNPSRSATLTGLHTYTSGMYSNYQEWREVPELQRVLTIGQHFRQNGYYTAGAGKIFHYDQDEETGDFETVDCITRQLQKAHDKPFFLAAGIYRPHLPWHVPQEYFDRFPLDSIKTPETFEDDLSDLGPVAKEIITRGGLSQARD